MGVSTRGKAAVHANLDRVWLWPLKKLTLVPMSIQADVVKSLLPISVYTSVTDWPLFCVEATLVAPQCSFHFHIVRRHIVLEGETSIFLGLLGPRCTVRYP